MRTLKLTIAYDGTRYAGWQVQNGRGPTGARSVSKPTIQGTLEQVLRRILQERVRVLGSGRTDAGVHALAQVAHTKTRRSMACGRLLRSVNQLLPEDIAVTQVEDVAWGFHARFRATRKRYRYRIFAGPVVPPFIRPYVHQVRSPLNVALMRREAAALTGRHDFRAFARAGSGRNGSVRTLTDLKVIRRDHELHVEVEGGGFLHTMVRSIVGTLLDVGRGRLPEGTIRTMLQTKQRHMAGTTAPAKGLCLVSVTYKVRAS
jgi:tRNA pseudouridine38-40 synthase